MSDDLKGYPMQGVHTVYGRESRIWDDLLEAEKAARAKATPRQLELEAAADAFLLAENYSMDLEVACQLAAEQTGADAKEIEAAYRFVNAID